MKNIFRALMFKQYVKVVTRIKKGISINEKYETPTNGYMVGIKNFKTLNDMLKVKLNTNEYYGTWLDEKTNTIYYDISINIQDYKAATELAKSRGELAIFDLSICDSIYL